jgi:hypothetical protein
MGDDRNIRRDRSYTSIPRHIALSTGGKGEDRHQTVTILSAGRKALTTVGVHIAGHRRIIPALPDVYFR